MALPELLLNSPTPGKREPITTLNVELSEAGTELEFVANVPTQLQKPGQYRITVGSEIILCEAKEENTKNVKVLERGAEGSTKVAHIATTAVYVLPTAESLRLAAGTPSFSFNYLAEYEQSKHTRSINFNSEKPKSVTKVYFGIKGTYDEAAGKKLKELLPAGTLFVVAQTSKPQNNILFRAINPPAKIVGLMSHVECYEVEVEVVETANVEGEFDTTVGDTYIAPMPGPENKLVEESIGMAYRNSAQNLAAATNTKIKLNSVIKDPGSNIGANEFYTVPATGYYHVDGEVLAVPAANAYLVANIWVNGVAALAGSMTSEGGEAYNGSSVSGIIYCAKGDKIELVGYNSGVEKALIIEAGKNRLSVNRVGAGPQGPQGPQGATGATGGPGKSWKVPVAYATTKALTIHSETSTTLTGEEEPLTIDGSIPALHGRVLVKNQSESKQDGIYEVTTLGSSGKTRWVLTRTGDANTSEELAEACVMVEAGTQNQGKRYSQRFGVTVVGTTAQEWLPSSVGPWTALESYTSKTESRTTQVRWENDGASARIHGTVLCNAALPASTKIFQLPEGFRPAETVFINIQQLAGSVVQLIIQTTGVVENRAETNSYLSFDGVTFQLV
jgi:hypothetical protein